MMMCLSSCLVRGAAERCRGYPDVEVLKFIYFRPITLKLVCTLLAVLVVAVCSSTVTRVGLGARIRVTG